MASRGSPILEAEALSQGSPQGSPGESPSHAQLFFVVTIGKTEVLDASFMEPPFMNALFF